ncbi:hypothetical protein MTO96_020703 [Rhipicephalus appendiculatus]
MILDLIAKKERATDLNPASYDDDTAGRLVGRQSTRKEAQVRERLIFVATTVGGESAHHRQCNQLGGGRPDALPTEGHRLRRLITEMDAMAPLRAPHHAAMLPNERGDPAAIAPFAVATRQHHGPPCICYRGHELSEGPHPTEGEFCSSTGVCRSRAKLWSSLQLLQGHPTPSYHSQPASLCYSNPTLFRCSHRTPSLWQPPRAVARRSTVPEVSDMDIALEYVDEKLKEELHNRLVSFGRPNTTREEKLADYNRILLIKKILAI